MAGIDDIDCSNFFDQIDDLLNIPDETCTDSGNVESGFFFGDFMDFPSIWTPSDTFTEDTKSVFSENRSSSSNSAPVPYEDIEQLEWLSNFVEDSFSSGNSLTIDVPNSMPNTIVSLSPSPTRFQTTSPVSVLESSSNSSYIGGKHAPVKQTTASGKRSGGRRKRARSERPRPPTSKLENFEFGNYDQLELTNSSKIMKSASNTHRMNKNKLIKMSVATEFDQIDEVRKCQHCEITKTPQWRAGPNGPKTLCNACGVRYKSGRLFPEYRPAASPTFVPTIHSNSHKKVLEMRVKATTSSFDDSPLVEDSCTE